MDEKLFVSLIKEFPVIYDKSRSDQDTVDRKNAWDAVANHLEISTAVCMRVWKSIRERYTKELKILRAAPTTSAVPESRWELFENLSFLKPHIRVRTFTGLDEHLLIKTVKRYPGLYNKYDPDYHNAIQKELAWCNISRICRLPVEDCMQLWKNMRERYSRECRRVQTAEDGASKWHLFESLSFLQPYIRHRRVSSISRGVNKVVPAWDGDKTIIDQETSYDEQPEPEEIHQEHMENIAESNNISEPSAEDNMAERISSRENVQLDQASDHDYVTVSDDHNKTSNSHVAADIAFGNYVGQCLAEITDKRTKNKIKLEIMQILHGED